MYGSNTMAHNGLQDMLDIFDYVKSSVVIAGHYSVNADGEGDHKSGMEETSSFRNGAELVRRAKDLYRHCTLALWVNDAAITEEHGDEFKKSYRLPGHYHEIARRNGVEDSDITVVFESALRKQARDELFALYRKIPLLFERSEAAQARVIRCIGEVVYTEPLHDAFAYMIRGPYREPIVVLDGARPKHNLVLASLFSQLKNRFTPEMFVTIFKESDEYRMALGTHIAKKLYALNTPILNAFCDDEDLSLFNFSDVPAKFRR